MGMNSTALAEATEVIDLTEPATDPHDGRPSHPLHRERGERFQLAYELGLPVGVLA